MAAHPTRILWMTFSSFPNYRYANYDTNDRPAQ